MRTNKPVCNLSSASLFIFVKVASLKWSQTSIQSCLLFTYIVKALLKLRWSSCCAFLPVASPFTSVISTFFKWRWSGWYAVVHVSTLYTVHICSKGTFEVTVFRLVCIPACCFAFHIFVKCSFVVKPVKSGCCLPFCFTVHKCNYVTLQVRAHGLACHFLIKYAIMILLCCIQSDWYANCPFVSLFTCAVGINLKPASFFSYWIFEIVSSISVVEQHVSFL